MRRNVTDASCKLVKASFSRGERNLLLQNYIKQRRKPRLAIPQRRRTVCIDDALQVSVFRGKLAAYAANVLRGNRFDFHRVRLTIAENVMSIIPKLATSLNRRDEVPNQELAVEIVKRGDKDAVAELVQNLANKNKGIRYDCIKVLYEIGYVAPKLIAGHISMFLSLLTSKDNRMQWGTMTALGCIAKEKPDEIFAELPTIIDAADKGSVITRDHCVNILIELQRSPRYANEAFLHLTRQLTTCPTNQLPMYVENAYAAITAEHIERFSKVLSSRLDEIEKESKRKRVEKVIKKMQKPARQ